MMNEMITPRSSAPLVALVAALAAVTGGSAMRHSDPEFDFRHAEEVRAWQPAHDIAALEPVRDGMLIRISGSDPYAIGPARDYPEGEPLWLNLRLKSDQGGTGQLFYFQRAATEK